MPGGHASVRPSARKQLNYWLVQCYVSSVWLRRAAGAQVTQIVSLRNEVMDLSERLRRAEADKLEIEGQLHTLKDTITSKKAEGEREQRKREKMEKEMADLRSQLDSRTADVKTKQAAITQARPCPSAHLLSTYQLGPPL